MGASLRRLPVSALESTCERGSGVSACSGHKPAAWSCCPWSRPLRRWWPVHGVLRATSAHWW